MRPFEYAAPTTEQEAVELLNDRPADTTVLAGGTDLIGLMQTECVTPTRVVNLKEVDSLRGVSTDGDNVVIGAMTTLEDIVTSPLVAEHQSLSDVASEIRSLQLHQSGTLGGDICLMPNCWYFRKGYGLLGIENGRSLPEVGENRYHAIFGNSGPAKFVSASRFAPALIAWNASVRVIGPSPNQSELIPLRSFFQTPKTERQSLTVLQSGQIVSQIVIPGAQPGERSAAYEVMELKGLDWPLAAASAWLSLRNGIVQEARIVMGHVAPTPWQSSAAAASIVGHSINEATADHAGLVAVQDATPLSDNEYKVQIAKTAVKRALLRAADRDGFDQVLA